MATSIVIPAAPGWNVLRFWDDGEIREPIIGWLVSVGDDLHGNPYAITYPITTEGSDYYGYIEDPNGIVSLTAHATFESLDDARKHWERDTNAR